MRQALIAFALLAAACGPHAETPAAPAAEAPATVPAPQRTAADGFMEKLQTLCGKSFGGKVVSTDALDVDMAKEVLRMTVQDCTPTEVRVPFVVGADASRTWVVTRTDTGLRLKHVHRHADGVEDKLSQYGGDTMSGGTAVRQEFPADQFSKDLFQREGNPASVTNVWAMEVTDAMFAYELRRAERFFRVEFDLTAPLP
jgi:hypothetical protein